MSIVRRTILFVGIVFILFIVAWTSWMKWSSINMDSGSLQDRVLKIASHLRAPGDQNTMTVAESNSAAAEHMKYQIQVELLADKTPVQIIADMTKSYGVESYAVPPGYGFGATVWMVPMFGLLLMFIIVAWQALSFCRAKEAYEQSDVESFARVQALQDLGLERMEDPWSRHKEEFL